MLWVSNRQAGAKEPAAILHDVLCDLKVQPQRLVLRRHFQSELTDQQYFATLLFECAVDIEEVLAEQKRIKPTRMRLRFYHDFALALEASAVRVFAMAGTFINNWGRAETH